MAFGIHSHDEGKRDGFICQLEKSKVDNFHYLIEGLQILFFYNSDFNFYLKMPTIAINKLQNKSSVFDSP